MRHMNHSFLRGASTPKVALWVLMAAAALSAPACLDSPDAPELAGPSTYARVIELRALPDQLVSDGWSSAVIEATLHGPDGERLSGATIHFDIQGYVDRGNLAPLNGPRPIEGGVEAGPVAATTDGNGVARARYWAPFRTDQPDDYIVTILAREAGTNFRQVEDRYAQTDIFLRAADRPYPGPIPVPQPGCEPPTADLLIGGLCSGGEIRANRPVFTDGSGSEGGTVAGGTGAGIVTYIWSWGDGTSDVTGSSTASHTYDPSLVGFTTTIQLTVVNSCGASASAAESDLEIVGVCPP